MKIKENFMLRELAGVFVVVPVSTATKDFNGMINLNEPGAFLWKCLQEDLTKEELINKLMNEYTVDEATASKDVDNFVEILKSNNLLQ